MILNNNMVVVDSGVPFLSFFFDQSNPSNDHVFNGGFGLFLAVAFTEFYKTVANQIAANQQAAMNTSFNLFFCVCTTQVILAFLLLGQPRISYSLLQGLGTTTGA